MLGAFRTKSVKQFGLQRSDFGNKFRDFIKEIAKEIK